MNENTFFFYLPKGTFKFKDILSIIYIDSSLDNILIQCNNETIEIQNSIKLKESSNWILSKYPQLNLLNGSKFLIEFKNQKEEFDLDEITFISQTEDKIEKEKFLNKFIFRFRAGFFIKKSDYNLNIIKIDKPIYLSQSKRISFENSCIQYNLLYNNYENLFNFKFKELFNKFEEYKKELFNQRELFYENYKESIKDSPILNLNNNNKIENIINNNKIVESSEEPINIIHQEFINYEQFSIFPEKVNNKSPNNLQIKQFLIDLNNLFPLNINERLFCGINEKDSDLLNQKMFLFNLIHYLLMYSTFTGITFDYRITLIEGWYRIEERINGIEIKKELMNKSNIFDNPYRKSIINCLIKICIELNLNIKDNNDIINMIYLLQEFPNKYL